MYVITSHMLAAYLPQRPRHHCGRKEGLNVVWPGITWEAG